MLRHTPPPEAAQSFREILRLRPKSGWALFNLSAALHYSGKKDEAMEGLLASLQLYMFRVLLRCAIHDISEKPYLSPVQLPVFI